MRVTSSRRNLVRFQRRRGFSLIELIMVIGIIAILIALLFPTLTIVDVTGG